MTVSLASCSQLIRANGAAAAERPLAIAPLLAILRQLGDLVETLSDGQYTANPVGIVTSSIGGHVRHCLDHVDALLAGIKTGKVNYDQRQRGTDVETQRQTALDTIGRQTHCLQTSPLPSVEAPLCLTALVSNTLPPVDVQTTVGRELAFVLSHTIHHNALVAVMARTLGLSVPDCFGSAPATIAHRETACAR
jgi:uncharacterized damage-inducible protein DinB